MPADTAPRVRVGVFARAPRPGFTKTRLIPAVGADGAAALSLAFLEDTVTGLLERGGAEPASFELSLFAAAPPDRPFLAERWPAIPVHAQPEGSLGTRIEHAMALLLDGADAAVLIGSDAPTMPPSHVSTAATALTEGSEVVFGPAADGGYTLIGVRRPLALGDVRWSSRHTLADTTRAAAGRTVRWLPLAYDVDNAADLSCLVAHLAVEPRLAPNTRAVLGTMRLL